jgi:hypothetical protein
VAPSPLLGAPPEAVSPETGYVLCGIGFVRYSSILLVAMAFSNFWFDYDFVFDSIR